MHTLVVTNKIGRRRRLLSLGLTGEEMWNMPLLMYFPFNGTLNPANHKFLNAVATVLFGMGLLHVIVRNRFHVRWELWTCRIAAFITLNIVLSVAWNGQPLLAGAYPCLVAVLTFFYFNYLLDHFSANSLTRMMLWSFGILLAISIVFSFAVPTLGIDHGFDDPNNAGAWQGIFAQKNQLGMGTVLAIAMAFGIRPKGQLDRFWRAFVIFAALVCAAGSRSREAWAAIALQISALASLWVLRKFRLRSQPPVFLGSALVGTVLAILAYINLDQLLALVGRSRTASGRTYIWEGAFLLIHRRPWLGYGVYGVWHTPVAWDVIARAGWNVPSSHNNYIEILLYYGIVGLTIYLLLLLSFFLFAIKAFLGNRLVEIVPGVYVLIGVLVLSMASPITEYFPSASLLLMFFYISRLEQQETGRICLPA
jgi:exopolysaccharide production protein ExoQ